MAMDGELQIRALGREEMALPLDWAAREGWNPGLCDAECFFATDGGGFLVGEIGGAAIGTISAVRYGDAFGFIGFYIVRPDVRGRGYGMQLWRAAMERLAGRNIGLDGVVAQQANYAKSGFRLAHRNVRYEGAAVGEGSVLGRTPSRCEIVPVGEVALRDIAAYDRTVFPASREEFLAAWLPQLQAGAWAAVDANGVRGFVVVRPCRQGWKIGPLAADDLNVARQLYAAAAKHAGEGATLFLDVPEPNRAALSLASELGMTPVFETARMYTGAAPAVELAKLFGVTSFELG
ncbi:GNAT family N-acetyltransferase [Lacipirellula parvula]|uniref:Acetyltransferase n=1 Tax=Lacipirellula parvula TaxID=2650471 RepID=A0A5K7XGB9_9BACT|nr:GNAT family N-acetyltransferase [Lacipirellula parvula]BBO35924.1 acetyltransferase [Lacipirellula parvula]